MKAEENLYVAIDYTLTLDSGEVVDKSEPGEPLGFIFGKNQIIPGLERELRGMEEGQTKKVTVEPEDAYGLPSQDLLREIPRENFPADMEIEPGMGFEARGPHGPVVFRVNEVRDDVVVADFNHPLAGERLHFEVTVAEVRKPRPEEMAAMFQASDCDTPDCGGCSGGCA
ncbi:FKBP-type peptidyl-prolyl cis-trans isomerase [Deferrisoma palaeochoriense]